jgi:3-oxoacyl-[acyl-carrier-protein] synthase II
MKKDMYSNQGQKIAITGIGVVSPIGIGKDAFFEGLENGRSGFRPVSLFASERPRLAAEIHNFDPKTYLGDISVRNLDRTTTMLLTAAKLAMEDGRLTVTEENATEIGIVIGSTMGSISSVSKFDRDVLKNGYKNANPGVFPSLVMCAAASQVSIKFGIKGMISTISSGYASGLDAMGYAIMAIETGKVKRVLVGAVEELCEEIYRGFAKLGLLAGSTSKREELCSPFDRRRNGFILGEGAVVFQMESLEDARKRGAHVYAVVNEYSSHFIQLKFDRRNIDRMVTDSARLVSDSIANARIAKDEIDLVVSGANSTLYGDICDAELYKRIFSDVENGVPVSAVKSLVGEGFSVSSGFQIAAALYALDKQRLFPTPNLEVTDDRCHMPTLVQKGVQAQVRNCLVYSTGLGGSIASLLLSRDQRQ